MFENILGSKTKRLILGQLLVFPKRSFTMKELAGTARVSLRLASEALRDLARAEIVEAAAKKGRRYWRLNSYFPFLNELRELSLPARPKMEDPVARRLRALPDVRLAVLSGIFTFQPHLPVDLLVVGDELSRPKLTRAVEEIEDMIGQEVNYAHMPRAEYDERRFLSDRLIRDILDNPHIVVLNTIRKS